MTQPELDEIEMSRTMSKAQLIQDMVELRKELKLVKKESCTTHQDRVTKHSRIANIIAEMQVYSYIIYNQ